MVALTTDGFPTISVSVRNIVGVVVNVRQLQNIESFWVGIVGFGSLRRVPTREIDRPLERVSSWTSKALQDRPTNPIRRDVGVVVDDVEENVLIELDQCYSKNQQNSPDSNRSHPYTPDDSQYRDARINTPLLWRESRRSVPTVSHQSQGLLPGCNSSKLWDCRKRSPSRL